MKFLQIINGTAVSHRSMGESRNWAFDDARTGRPNRILLNRYKQSMARLPLETKFLVTRLAGVGAIDPHLIYADIPAVLRRQAIDYVQSVRHRFGDSLQDVSDEDLSVAGVFLAKKFIMRHSERYSLSEIVNATLGRMSEVDRREHKGFDYESMISEVGKHFQVLEITGIPYSRLPCPLSFGIGVVAQSRPAVVSQRSTTGSDRSGRCS